MKTSSQRSEQVMEVSSLRVKAQKIFKKYGMLLGAGLPLVVLGVIALVAVTVSPTEGFLPLVTELTLKAFPAVTVASLSLMALGALVNKNSSKTAEEKFALSRLPFQVFCLSSTAMAFVLLKSSLIVTLPHDAQDRATEHKSLNKEVSE